MMQKTAISVRSLLDDLGNYKSYDITAYVQFNDIDDGYVTEDGEEFNPVIKYDTVEYSKDKNVLKLARHRQYGLWLGCDIELDACVIYKGTTLYTSIEDDMLHQRYFIEPPTDLGIIVTLDMPEVKRG